MWTEHLRAWFLGKPVEVERIDAQARARDARRDVAACGPKPVPEAVGDAISAVGELVRALRSTMKHPKAAKKHRKKAAKSPGSTRSRKTPARRGVVVVEAHVEPRAVSHSRTRVRRSARMTLDAPIVVAPAGSPTPPQTDED